MLPDCVEDASITMCEFKILNLQLKFMMKLKSQCKPLLTSFSKVNKAIAGLISAPEELVVVVPET